MQYNITPNKSQRMHHLQHFPIKLFSSNKSFSKDSAFFSVLCKMKLVFPLSFSPREEGGRKQTSFIDPHIRRGGSIGGPIYMEGGGHGGTRLRSRWFLESLLAVQLGHSKKGGHGVSAGVS